MSHSTVSDMMALPPTVVTVHYIPALGAESHEQLVKLPPFGPI